MLDNNNIFIQQIITGKNEKTRRTIRTSKFEFQIDINLKIPVFDEGEEDKKDIQIPTFILHHT
jgi:hypothetical protein